MFLCFVLASIIFSSCSKDSGDTLSNDDIENNQTNSNYTVVNDVMTFESIEKFQAYYETLDAMDDQQLQRVMNAYEVNSVFKRWMGDSFVDPADRYQPFLADIIMMGIVNENFEFQFGDVLLTYVTNEYILSSNIADIETRDQIRELAKGNKFDFDNVPDDAYLVSTNKYETLLGPWGEVAYQPVVIETANRGCIRDGTDSKLEINGNFGLISRCQSFRSWGWTKEETVAVPVKITNGRFSVVDAHFLGVKIQAVRRNSECQTQNFAEELEACSNCDFKRAKVSAFGNRMHQTNDVQGTVEMEINDNNNFLQFHNKHIVQYD